MKGSGKYGTLLAALTLSYIAMALAQPTSGSPNGDAVRTKVPVEKMAADIKRQTAIITEGRKKISAIERDIALLEAALKRRVKTSKTPPTKTTK